MEHELNDGKTGQGKDESQKSSSPTTWVVRPDPDLEDLIPSFMQNRRNELQDIDGAVARGDFEAIRRVAHTWKGICRPYGFVHLETLSRNLEVAGEHESTEEAKSIAGEIRVYLDNVRIVYEQ